MSDTLKSITRNMTELLGQAYDNIVSTFREGDLDTGAGCECEKNNIVWLRRV